LPTALGSIENGKIANLIVADGDLFEEKRRSNWFLSTAADCEVREPEKQQQPP